MSRDSAFVHVDVGCEVVKVATCIEHVVVLKPHKQMCLCVVCGQVFCSDVIMNIQAKRRIGNPNHGKAQV